MSIESNTEKTGAQPASPIQDLNGLRLLLLQELGAALRARSEAEHIYTAAAVGSFGAVAWGAAALDPTKYLTRPVYMRPASMAVIGILFVAVFIVLKINREHRVYATTKKAQARIAKQLASPEVPAELIPDFMLNEESGPGYKGSLWIVVVAACGAIAFCLLLVR